MFQSRPEASATTASSAPPTEAPRRGLPMRWLIVGTVLIPLLILAGALVTLSGLSNKRIAEELGASLLDSASARVQAEINDFLDAPVRLSNLYARRIAAGALPTQGLTAWEPSELDDLVTNPDIASICFGNETGETTWVLRHAGRLEVGRVSSGTGHATEHIISEAGDITPTPLRTYQYNPRERPWYATAIRENAPLWTPIYFWFGDQGSDLETGAGFTRPITGLPGQPSGVLVIDVTLGGLSSFLATLPLARTGGIFIIDDQDLIVGASHGQVTTVDGRRMPLKDALDPRAKAAAEALLQAGGQPLVRGAIDDEAAWIRLSPFHPHRGMHWRILSVVPESVFLSEASAVQRRSLWASLLAIAAGIAVALILGRHLATPLFALASHVRKVALGDFSSRIDLRQARELSDVSHELNRMTAGLEERLELQQALSLATEVQQSLLPQSSPSVHGLDIAGRSRYCDSTGGDYYDFIDVSGLPTGAVLVAVGDVMGHGIAAALLMATARAALRAHAGAGVSLGDLLTRVNAILSKDARHGRFMTMVLLVVDPAARSMRWASAGHDPPLVYDAASRRFIELEGGGMPLGIDDGEKYEEYRVSALTEGSILVLGTDGIWEAANAANEMFGHDRLRRIIERHAMSPSSDILKAIGDELTTFYGSLPAKDDITAVVVRLADAASHGS